MTDLSQLTAEQLLAMLYEREAYISQISEAYNQVAAQAQEYYEQLAKCTQERDSLKSASTRQMQQIEDQRTKNQNIITEYSEYQKQLESQILQSEQEKKSLETQIKLLRNKKYDQQEEMQDLQQQATTILNDNLPDDIALQLKKLQEENVRLKNDLQFETENSNQLSNAFQEQIEMYDQLNSQLEKLQQDIVTKELDYKAEIHKLQEVLTNNKDELCYSPIPEIVPQNQETNNLQLSQHEEELEQLKQMVEMYETQDVEKTDQFETEKLKLISDKEKLMEQIKRSQSSYDAEKQKLTKSMYQQKNQIDSLTIQLAAEKQKLITVQRNIKVAKSQRQNGNLTFDELFEEIEQLKIDKTKQDQQLSEYKGLVELQNSQMNFTQTKIEMEEDDSFMEQFAAKIRNTAAQLKTIIKPESIIEMYENKIRELNQQIEDIRYENFKLQGKIPLCDIMFPDKPKQKDNTQQSENGQLIHISKELQEQNSLLQHIMKFLPNDRFKLQQFELKIQTMLMNMQNLNKLMKQSIIAQSVKFNAFKNQVDFRKQCIMQTQQDHADPEVLPFSSDQQQQLIQLQEQVINLEVTIIQQKNIIQQGQSKEKYLQYQLENTTQQLNGKELYTQELLKQIDQIKSLHSKSLLLNDQLVGQMRKESEKQSKDFQVSNQNLPKQSFPSYAEDIQGQTGKFLELLNRNDILEKQTFELNQAIFNLRQELNERNAAIQDMNNQNSLISSKTYQKNDKCFLKTIEVLQSLLNNMKDNYSKCDQQIVLLNKKYARLQSRILLLGQRNRDLQELNHITDSSEIKNLIEMFDFQSAMKALQTK